jgi:DNA-binding CsgD family transcriptional regulator
VAPNKEDQSSGFVGRQRELGELTSALDDAISGRDRLVMLAGEPGIGKTRTAQELSAIADTRSTEVYWGYCYEGEGAPPYWPWLQILRSQIEQSDAERLGASMGIGAEVIGEIVPELRSKLPDLGSPPAFDPASARFRLFDSITTYLKNVSADRSLVLILEDLHWADASSLALLEHVSGDMRPSNMLIVGTYRDIEVPDSHLLSRIMGSLVRRQGYQSLRLGGLSKGDVGEMVTTLVGEGAPPDMAEKVHLRTEGNALFVVELLQLLEANGSDETQEWRFSIPQGIRGVINRRFDGLSDQCNQALAIASVIGREFEFDMLSQMTGSSDDDLLNVVDEAVDAHVIEDMRGSIERYRFTHALIEQTLYERQTSSRRARMHSRIGEMLEDTHWQDLEAHASELVRHFSRSPARQDSEKVLQYGRLAANHATSVYAYDEAAIYLEQCLNVQKTLNPEDDVTRSDLLKELGEGLILAGAPERVFEEIAPEAYALAEARDDSGQAFQSCRMALHGLMAFGAATGISMPEFAQWAERADRHAEPETIDRVEADIAMAGPKYSVRDYSDAWRLLHKAKRLAQELGEPEYIVRSTFQFLGWTWPPQYQEELFEMAREGADSPIPEVDPRLHGEFLGGLVKYLMWAGDSDRASRMLDRTKTFVEQTKIPLLRALSLGREINVKTYEGELEGAVQAIDDLIVGSEELGSAAMGRQISTTRGMVPLLYLGRVEEALALLPQAGGHVGLEADSPATGLQAQFSHLYVLCLAHAGRLTEAQKYFNLAVGGIESRLTKNQVDWAMLATLLETALILKDVEVARTLAGQLEEGAGGPGIPRLLGEAANLAGESDRALKFFHEALEVSIKARHRPEQALSRFDMADLCLDHYPDRRDEALEHLEFAIAEFREMKMQPSLDRALAVRQQTVSAPVPTPQLPDGLTAREAEVLGLIASGSSNTEIATELFLSVRTVERHITNIYRKIDARGRADAVNYALRHQLIKSP